MATFKPTSKAGKTTGAKKSTFTPTKYAGYNQSTLYGWQRQNQSALDLINQYNTRVNNGEWLSVEDRAKYKSAVDTYTSSGTALRNASKHYGTTYTDEEEKSWLDSLSSLNEGYTGVDKFYNQFKNDREYGVWKADADKRTEFEGLKNSNDYDYYVNIGKNSQANNIWNDIKKVADANHYSIGEFISDIKDGDWEALGGRALEQIISKFFPNSTIVNPVEVGSAFLDIRDFAKKWTTDKATMEEYLTPQEMDNYYYLIGKGDYEKANDYAKYYSNIARKEKGEAQVPNINNNIKELATAFKSGLDSFSTGFDQTLSVLGSVLYDKDVNVYNPTTSQYAYGKAREDNTGLWMMATDAAQSIGNQVPNYALAFATGGASEFIPMAISAGGNSYAEMINEGYGEGSAIAKGVATGALEALLGKWLGGLPGLGSSGGVFKGLQQKFLPQMSNTVARFLINNGVNMADEALEEGLQELLDPVVKWAVTLGEAELEKVNWEEVGYSALLGGLTAGVLEGVPSAIGTANTSIKTQQAFGNQAPSIVAETLAVDPTNKIALNAQNKLANNKTVSGGNLNEMLTTTDRARVKEAITNQLTEYGETSDISALAEALTKQTMGEELSKKESKLIESSKYGNRITNELNPNNIKSGQYTSKWAESIGTRRLNADVYSRRPSTKVKTKDGTNNTITNVRNVADGVATVELADGKVAKVGLDKGTTSDLVFNDPKTEGLFRIATDRVGKVEGWTTETANAMIKAYEGSTLDASAFARGWSEAYNIGKSNNSQAQLNNSSWAMLLDNKTRADAYNIGKAMSTPRVMTPTTNTYKVSFDSTVDEKSLTKEQKTQVKALDVISKALGVNVVVFDSPMGADGKRVGKNGSYNPNTRTVEIDLHAGADGRGVMLFTASHELTHHMKEVAKDKFNAYADAVFEALGENGRDLIESKLSALRANGHLDGKTDEEAYDLAFEEVVADSAEKMLVDTDALAKLSESLKSKDKTLWEKVKDYIVGLVDKIKKIYSSLDPDSQEARMLSDMEDEIENIRNLWVEGIVASAEVSDKVATELGIEIDTKSESVSPTLMSERTWTESEYVVNRDAMAKKIASALNISERKAKKYIDDVNSIARMIANDRARLDYQASSFGSAFVSNVEYGGSFDYTTLCKKRRLYTGTFSEIQKRLHDVALTPDEILTVRNMLIEAHKEATCGLCYVEGSRANMGKFAQKFIELYKRDNPDGWTPNMVDVNTPDGVEQMRINHPEAYEQYEYFWNHYGKLKDSDPALFASQQKPKLYEARKEYKGEILTHFKGETTIEKKNLNGGIRMQSFSDFEIIHLIDTMQVIMDMSTVGLAGQAYTKVPEFALAFGNTGLKINLSLIAKGVDENGKLIFDDREGMPHETAFDIRNKYSKNVGTIIVTFTDDQLMAAMADDRIDYIIPFHRSQWKKGQYGAMGLPKGTKDYTFMQNEKLIKQTYHEYQGRMVKDKATNYMPNEYWDFSKSGKENAEAYLKMCAENNKRPKFYKLLDYDGNGTYSLKKDGSTDGYWKLLIDFKMYDNNGKGSPQTPVVPNFNMEESTKMMEEYKGGHEKYPIAYDVVDKFVEQYNKDMGTKYSDRDSSYLDAVNRGDMETAQRMVDEAAKSAGYNSPKLYHGTKMFGFTKVKTSGVEKGIAWSPFFAANKEDISASYVPYGKVRDISSSMDDDAIEEARENAIEERKENISDLVYDFRRLIDKYFSPWVFGQTDNSYLEGLVEEANPEAGNGDGVYDVLSDIVYDSFYGYQDEFGEYEDADDWSENSPEGQEIFSKIIEIEGEKSALHRLESGEELGGIYQLYANLDNMFVVDGKGAAWNELRPEGLPKLERYGVKDAPYKTRDVAEWARDNGFDGVIFKNIRDNGAYGRTPAGDVYTFFHPESQIKSADPVTYDDDGNVIPLSQRFKAENDDIRYQDRLSPEESFSNRSLLTNALLDTVQSDIEYKKLDDYRAVIGYLEAEEVKLADLKHKIYEATFGGGDKSKLKELREEARKTEARIDLHDKKLLQLESTTALKNVLERAKKQAYSKALEKGREAMHRNVEGRRTSEIRHKIRKYKDNLIKTIEHPTERKYIPIDLVQSMIDVVDLIDTDTDLYKKNGEINKAQEKRNATKERLQKLRSEYENLKTNKDPLYAGEFDEAIYDYIKELQDNYSNKSINDMSLIELTEMYEILQAINETLLDARKLIGWTEGTTVIEAGDTIVAEQDEIRKARKDGKRNTAAKAKDAVIDLSLSPVRNVERMSGYNDDSPLVKLFHGFVEGVRKKNFFVMTSYRMFEKLTTGENQTVFEDARYKEFGEEMTDSQGRKFKVSKMQMMQAILSYERETANNQHHIEYGGFTFANLKLLSKGNIQQAISSENSHRVGNGEFIVHSFIKQLAGDKWCQDYMKMARKFFNESAKDAVNEATIALKHRIVARDSNYIPFEVDKNFVVSEITEESIQQTISSYGMLKDVNKQSAQPLIMTGLDNVIDRHIEQVGNIYGLAVPIRNFNKVWNVHSHTETLGGSGSVKDAVEAAWGKSGTKVITQTVRDLQGSRTVDNPDVYNAYSTIKGNVIGATFKLNLSVVTKQIGSLFTATSMLDWRNPASMLINLLDTMKNHDTISAEVDKYTATAWMRRQGLSDAELHTLATEGQKSKLKRWSNKLPTAISPDKWITGMDSMVALSLWKYAKEDVAKRTNLKGEALLKETAKFYDELVENTQSMSDVLHRPEVQRSKNILLETLSMFKTDLYQMAGQLQGAYGRYQANNSEENGKALAKTVGSVLMSTMWGALMTTLWALVRYKVNPYRDDEDDELTIESWLSRQGVAVVADLVGYVVPLFGSEAVGIIERIWTGETEDVADSLVLSAVNDVVSAIEGVANSAVEGELPKEEAFKGLLTKVCSLFGVPMSNILRIIEAIKLHGEDIANKEFLSFEAGLTRPNSTRLYNAYIERDPVKIERASRLYEDQKEIESALRKAIRDNDPRLEEAALARLNGDRDTYYRLMMDVIDEGNFDKQIIKDAFDAEYNYQKKKAEENK